MNIYRLKTSLVYFLIYLNLLFNIKSKHLLKSEIDETNTLMFKNVKVSIINQERSNKILKYENK